MRNVHAYRFGGESRPDRSVAHHVGAAARRRVIASAT
jgi:hypothetical protein